MDVNYFSFDWSLIETFALQNFCFDESLIIVWLCMDRHAY